MPAPSLTYTLTNGSPNDATQVMQNFNDLLNGYTDGTKDLSISALTVAGTATLNGAINLGNASSDDITVTGSLASTIPIKTTNTYNIGSSTLGLAGVYFGANSQTVRIVGSGSMSATWTLTLPVSAGTAGYALVTNGSGVASWSKEQIGTATNDDATAGYAGEYVTATRSRTGVALTTATTANVTNSPAASITLTAGDWDISAAVGFNPAAAGTSITSINAAVSVTSATLPASSTALLPNSSGEYSVFKGMSAQVPGSGNDMSVVIPPYRVSLSGSATLYLVAHAVFTVGGLNAYGSIRARRIR